MRTRRTRLVAGTAAALLVFGGGVVTGAHLLPGAVTADRSAAGTGMGMGMSEMAGSADAMFPLQMAVHHESAVQMAQLAQKRAQAPEVRQLARDIERSQTAEIARLLAAATRLGAAPDAPTGGMGSGMGSGMATGMGPETDLAEVPDEQFDRAFLEAMIPHHQMGVHMAQMVQRAGSDPQIAAMAAEMVRVQTDEIALMEGWLDQQ